MDPRTRIKLLSLAPWALSTGLAVAAVLLRPQLPQASWTPSASVLALALGVLTGSLSGLRAAVGAGVKKVSKTSIPWAIVAIGSGLDLGPLVRSGQLGAGLLVVVAAMLIAFGAALLFGKLFGIGPRASLLLGAGTAVCGNSAIMAVAPSVDPSDEELGLSLGVINLLGVVMLFALPPAAGFFGVEGDRGGALAGLTVHAVPQAIATGEAFGEGALQWATLYKLLRVAMLVPVVLIVGYALRRGGGVGSKSGPGVPWFVSAFVVAAVVRSACEALAPESLGGDALSAWGWTREAGRFILAVALAAIGVSLDPAALIRVGPRVLAVGAAAVTALVAATLPLVLWLL
ncbi:MAG: putative sulfate exporter family transporter [Planctomycetota bacterium]|nr:putative sulfate exporter family transporter [Planctomycetota bacterium]